MTQVSEASDVFHYKWSDTRAMYRLVSAIDIQHQCTVMAHFKVKKYGVKKKNLSCEAILCFGTFIGALFLFTLCRQVNKYLCRTNV